MTTALTIAAIAAALWIGICLGIALAVVWSARHDKTWEVERPEWADDRCPVEGCDDWPDASSPIYDRLVCEQIEHEEEWA